ncbi:cytochrome P450 [Catenulispora acidiphila DSM 44928]|uniref:Cytochrome P450 n=1 Tax=Catenulispora acidiphila (strain DSM 44928 / JCM 14897 / NBRC 102108 / NRRL B-24433 / ID139908) TaxID=479433 RepID=C7QED3_CATAD|nr:cytochrome P450 [Catenulispora acidiphila]ACU70824.1 cytochrome P450 [Catenulispora acidiphila DSM 44928]
MTLADTSTEVLAVPAERGTCPFDPPPAYDLAREQDPVAPVRLFDGSTAWMLTRHQDVRAVLQDRRFSADGTKDGFPFLSPGRRELATGNPTFIRMDDPEHARLRRMLTSDFIIKRVEEMRPQVRAIAVELLDAMTRDRDHADLVAEFALPLPSLVICLLLGVPYQDHAYFQKCSSTLLNANSTAEQVHQARDDLNTYIKQLAESKRDSDDEDIISRLMRREDLSPDEVATMGTLLLVAGHETTANMTSLSILTLLRDPEQMARLRSDPGLIRGAVEELLRYLSIVHTGLPRVATEDVELNGRTIRAGDGVLLMINTANRDSEAFPDADSLDVGRDARRHLAFGFGVHQCLGQPLARAELQIALDVLLTGLPNLRLAVPFEQIPFRHDMLIYGVHRLPIAW